MDFAAWRWLGPNWVLKLYTLPQSQREENFSDLSGYERCQSLLSYLQLGLYAGRTGILAGNMEMITSVSVR